MVTAIYRARGLLGGQGEVGVALTHPNRAFYRHRVKFLDMLIYDL